jgi:PTS system mannose-specific IIC component
VAVAWGEVLAAGAWGGALALERKAFLQAMLSRPLVAATGMGLLLGDLDSGLAIGMVLELYYLGSASLGAAVPEHDTLVACGSTAFAASLSEAPTSGYAEQGSTPALWSLALLSLLWLGQLGRALDRVLGQYSTRLADRAQASAEKGELNRAVRQNLWGMWPHFVVFGVLSAMCALFGAAVAGVVGRFPLPLARGLAWAYPAMASVAAAVAAQGSRARHAALYAGGAGGLVAAYALFTAWRGGGL